MTSLLHILYQYIMERSGPRVCGDLEYRSAVQQVDQIEEQLRAKLGPEERQLLSQLMDEMVARSAIETELMFRETLDLSRELVELVRG